jgi:hypothetical protein
MVIFKRLQVSFELPETFPQGLKPSSFAAICGTTEVVPFQNINDHLRGGHHQETASGMIISSAQCCQRIRGIKPIEVV